jgi:hypothetical protein
VALAVWERSVMEDLVEAGAAAERDDDLDGGAMDPYAGARTWG